jgi:phage-related baseplate assembly protein
MSLVSLASLLVKETKEQIYERALAVATSLSLRVSSWAPGDPTRSFYHVLSTVLSIVEENVAGYVSSGFLDYAAGDWLTVLAQQLYRVDRIEATYATTTITLTNNGGGYYEIDPGDLTVQHATSGKTYRNTTGGILQAWSGSGPNPTLTLDITADEVGAESSAGANEITELVTSLLGVTCDNATAAIGLDAEEDAALKERCRAKLGMLSPNGPTDVYNYVVRTPSLTGSTEITRSRTSGDSTTGDVTIWVAGASGAVSGGAVTAAQNAVAQYAAPLCITPTVVNASALTVNITYTVWLYDSVGETAAAIEEKIEDDLAAAFQTRPIGGDVIGGVGKLYKSFLEATIKASYPDHVFRVSVATPSGDTTLAANEVATLGTVTATVNLEPAP